MSEEMLTEKDVFTLIGHAEFLRRVRGEREMPDYFYDLAERIAKARGDEGGAKRCAEMRKQQA